MTTKQAIVTLYILFCLGLAMAIVAYPNKAHADGYCPPGVYSYTQQCIVPGCNPQFYQYYDCVANQQFPLPPAIRTPGSN